MHTSPQTVVAVPNIVLMYSFHCKNKDTFPRVAGLRGVHLISILIYVLCIQIDVLRRTNTVSTFGGSVRLLSSK